MNEFWTHPIPIWVSRKTIDNEVSNFTVPGWLFMVIGVIVLVNFLVWGVIGGIEAVQYFVELF